MMKKVKTKNGILWFYLIDAVLLVVLFLALIPFKDKNSPEQKTTALLNPNYKEKVAAVKISTPLENGKRTSVTIVKRGDFFLGTDSATENKFIWPADLQSVVNLIETASEIQTINKVADSVTSWKNFNVDEKKSTHVIFYDEKGIELSNLFFGSTNALNGKTAFRTSAEQTVWEGNGTIEPYLTTKVSFWADCFIYPQIVSTYSRKESESLLRRGEISNLIPPEDLKPDFVFKKEFENGNTAFYRIYSKENDYIVIPEFKAYDSKYKELFNSINYRYSISSWTFSKFQELF